MASPCLCNDIIACAVAAAGRQIPSLTDAIAIAGSIYRGCTCTGHLFRDGALVMAVGLVGLFRQFIFINNYFWPFFWSSPIQLAGDK